jgi:hypothetical protein
MVTLAGTIMNTDLFLTFVLCLGLPMLIILVAAVVGTRARLREADRIRRDIATGGFHFLLEPRKRAQIRVLALIGLVLLGCTLAVVVAASFRPDLLYTPPGLIVAALTLMSTFALGVYFRRVLSHPTRDKGSK